jgi:DNA-binding MarR family transcriptional regulator
MMGETGARASVSGIRQQTLRSLIMAPELDARVWWALLRAHHQVTRALETAFADQLGLSLSGFEILLRLAYDDSGSMRMTRLADMVLLKPSSLSRLVDQLEARGLIERRRDPEDLRGFLAVITDAGLERLAQAAPVHLQCIDEHLTANLTTSQRQELARLLEGALQEPARIPPSSLGAFLRDLAAPVATRRRRPGSARRKATGRRSRS